MDSVTVDLGEASVATVTRNPDPKVSQSFRVVCKLVWICALAGLLKRESVMAQHAAVGIESCGGWMPYRISPVFCAAAR